jgi:hypothetical protein
MSTLTIHSYSLNRLTTTRTMREARLPCSLNQALEFLALYLGTKALMLPSEFRLAYPISPSPLFVREIPVAEVTRTAFDRLYPVLPHNRWRHLVRRLLVYLPTMWFLNRQQNAVRETVFEIFATANGLLYRGPLPETMDESMLLASIHFWAPGNTFTYVCIYFGWHDDFSQETVQLLHRIIEGYLSRMLYLYGSDTTIAADNPGRVATKGPIHIRADPVQAEPLNDPPDPFDLGERPLYAQVLREEKCHIIKPPRIYPRSLAKICRMVCHRQRQIEAGKVIPDIEQMRSRTGPSVNTLRKLPELVSNWDNPDYRWYADNWLREQSGHAAHEVTKLLSELRAELTKEDWAMVITQPDGRTGNAASPNGSGSLDMNRSQVFKRSY